MLLHSISPELLGPAMNFIDPIVALAVGDELLAIVTRYGVDSRDGETSIVRCQGLGSEKKELIWQRAKTPSLFPKPAGFTCLSLSLSRFHI